MKNLRIEAVILAIGLALTGYFVKAGIDTLATRDRVVTVKGLAEMEVPADKVTWPLMYKSIGNDLPALYSQIEATNQKIQAFLTSKGIDAGEISINAPEIVDLQAERYSNNDKPYRYNITTVITVTSGKVDLVRGLIGRAAETRHCHQRRRLPLQRVLRLHQPELHQAQDDRRSDQERPRRCRKVRQGLRQQTG